MTTEPLGGPAWRDAAAQVLVDSLDAPEPDDAGVHHLARVLRLRAGERVCATDGAGGWRMCVLGEGGRLEPVAEARVEPAPPFEVTVGFAPVKGERPELVVQKLTELGVDRIVPFTSHRSVVRWDDARAAKQLDRWFRIVREAAAQCRRLHLPRIESHPEGGLHQLSDLLIPRERAHRERVQDGRARKAPFGIHGFVAADAGGRPVHAGDVAVLIGPEGGWEPGELDGVERVGLSDQVLRAETAAIVAGAVVVGLRSGWLAPSTG